MARGTRATQEPRTIPDDLVLLSRWGTEERERDRGSSSGAPVPIASTSGHVLRSHLVRADVLRAAVLLRKLWKMKVPQKVSELHC